MVLSRKKMGATNGGVEYTLLESTAKQRWALAGSKGLSAAAAVNNNRDRAGNTNTSTIGTVGISSNGDSSNSNSESKAPGGFAGRSLLAAAQDPTAIAPQSAPSTKVNATQSSSPSAAAAAGSITTTSTESLTAGPASPSPTSAEPTVDNSSEISLPSLPPPEEAARSSSGASPTSMTTPGFSSSFNQTPEAKVAVVSGVEQEDTEMSAALAASERLVAELQASSALRTEQVLPTHY